VGEGGWGAIRGQIERGGEEEFEGAGWGETNERGDVVSMKSRGQAKSNRVVDAKVQVAEGRGNRGDG